MTTLSKRHLIYIYLIFLTSIYNLEGFIHIVLGYNATLVGANNILIAIISIFLLISLCFFSDNDSRYILYGTALVGIMSYLILLFNIVESEYRKTIRDIAYLILYFLNFYFLFTVRKEIARGRAPFYFIVVNLVILPLISFVLGVTNENNRFLGFQMASSIVSNGSVLLLMFSFMIVKSKVKIVLLLICLTIIYCSGVRSSLFILFVFIFFLYSNSVSGNKPFFYIFSSLLIVVMPLLFLYSSEIVALLSNSETRVFSTQDLEQGSLSTRISWYVSLMGLIIQDGGFGGFGPGAAERYIGFITHFDLLRFWVDYSILFVLFFIWLNVWLIFRNYRSVAYLIMFSLVHFLLSLHNVMLIPSLFMIFSFVMSVLLYKNSGEYEDIQ
tara:strand:+ start:9825 stop:10976 length:1152 start_codon:yes stop_codon:yes gene_type:complete